MNQPTSLTRRPGIEPGLDDTADTDTNHPLNPDKIRITTTPSLIDGIIQRIDKQEIHFAPACQRKARLWTPARKSRLIESLLLKIPLPPFYAAVDAKGHWSVVDGTQRLTIIHDFNKNGFALDKLDYLPQLNGATFAALPRAFQRRIEEATLLFHLVQDGTPDDVMLNIFTRLNTGGTALTTQEIRTALSNHLVHDFLQELARSNEFLTATSWTMDEFQSEAHELVLRFAAFYLHPWTSFVEHNRGFPLFLFSAARTIANLSIEAKQTLAQQFGLGLKVAYAIFGADTFRRPGTVHQEQLHQINPALFEVWSVSLALCTPEQQTTLIEKNQRLMADFGLLMNEPDFISAISSSGSTAHHVEQRFSRVSSLIQQILHDFSVAPD